MNNNKKYKKWSLGLVAPALVLAPIAVVASCSSSGEEKAVYSVSFKQPTLSAEVSNKNIKPSKLSREGFVQEIINNKTNIFNIEDSSGKVTDDFLRENLVVGDITPDDSKNTASAQVTLNNKNTDGESENATITLTGFNYQDVDLANLTYTIEFKDKDNDPQTIELEGKSEVLVSSIDKSGLIRLVLEETIKNEILTITGDDAAKITNEVLENQILEIADSSIESNKVAGTVKFGLKVLNNGSKDNPEISKEIMFTGFKQETENPPAETEQFKIKFKIEAEELENVSDRSVNDFSSGDDLKQIVIENRDKIFETEIGALPGADWWTEKKLTISKPTLDVANGSVTVNISLDGYDTTDSAGQDNTLTKNDVVLKGFKKEAQTVIETKELSTVTLGLNGTVTEAANDVNSKWVLEHKRLLFTKGFNLIENETDIKEVSLTVDAQQKTKATLSFKVEANKWFETDGVLGTTDKEFTVKILGFSSAETAGKLLTHKSGTGALSIGLVDPVLAEGTYEQFKDESAKIFTKDFIFKYRKHLLTGDFSKIDSTPDQDFLYEYPADTNMPKRFVKVSPNDSDQTIEITFTILKEKLVEGTSSPTDNKEYTIKFNGFKASSN